ncbi:hypothetical protein IFO68_16445 [Photobacterium sp. CAU 1568]|uniref:Uncharacterized protein n=1 Tax=Photobacterium arenosum TaxID=2774143 RepID=A0ABR9BNY7_9GAMM|nr:hypothetical protein [Photobacterium arenosum]MBD8514274.1 hypothetical protein [Photobacterium arenosum]
MIMVSRLSASNSYGLEPLDQPLTMQRRRVQAAFVLVELGVVAADLVGLRKCRDRHPKVNLSVGSGRSQ